MISVATPTFSGSSNPVKPLSFNLSAILNSKMAAILNLTADWNNYELCTEMVFEGVGSVYTSKVRK